MFNRFRALIYLEYMFGKVCVRLNQIFFHIDVNSAFLSWTAIDQRQKAIMDGTLDSYIDIREIPAIIGGDSSTRHGIVLAKSIPAKKYNISTAETIISALKKCPSLTIVPPDHDSYRKHSHELMEYLSSYCPIIEQVSIDECYMDYTPISKDFASPEEAADTIRNGVHNKFGFTVNIGISDRKMLAKMASDFKKPDMTHTLYSSEIRSRMWPLPISSLFMCGRSSQETLKKLGITTIGELACSDMELIVYHLKSHGKLLWEYANGIDSSAVQYIPSPAKGIGNSTTLPEDISDIDKLRPVLLQLCESVSKRLRKVHSVAGTVTVEIKYHNFQSCSHQMSLREPSNTSTKLYETSLALLDELWNGEPVRLLGVRATRLKDESAPVQLDLFSYQAQNQKSEKIKKLDHAMDEIRQKYGDNAIVRGSLLSMPKSKKSNSAKNENEMK